MVDSTYHIIGSGISGLVAAYELARKGKNVRVYEKLGLVGGIARTEDIDGVSYDCGPHLFHTNNSEINIKIYMLIHKYKTDITNIYYFQ